MSDELDDSPFIDHAGKFWDAFWDDGPDEKEDPPRNRDGSYAPKELGSHLTGGRLELDPKILQRYAGLAAEAARSAGDQSPRIGLRSVRTLRVRVERLELYAVANARGLGWSWAEIGSALGISKQVLQRRYGRVQPKLGRRRRR